MPHPSHQMSAYRDGMGWQTFCQKCSAETEDKLSVECPGKYVRDDANSTYRDGMEWIDKDKEDG